MATQIVSGPSSIFIGAGQTSVTATYTASKLPASWSYTVLSDGALDPGDYSITLIGGMLTVTLLPGATIPPGGVTLSLRITATHSGGGNGNVGSHTVSVNIDENAVPCFVEGTMILTAVGERPVESLEPGDRIVTKDRRVVILRHLLRRDYGPEAMAAGPAYHPIRIRAGAFGPEAPHSDLYVSPSHRIHVGGWRSELLFGQPSVLVQASHLIDDMAVMRDPRPEGVTYYHLAFDSHEIVIANGLATESLHFGPMLARTLNRQDYTRLYTRHSEVLEDSPARIARTSHYCLVRREAEVLKKSLQH